MRTGAFAFPIVHRQLEGIKNFQDCEKECWLLSTCQAALFVFEKNLCYLSTFPLTVPITIHGFRQQTQNVMFMYRLFLQRQIC